MVINRTVKENTADIGLTNIREKNNIAKIAIFLFLEVLSFASVIINVTSTSMISSYQYMYLLPLSFLAGNSFLYFKITKGSFTACLPRYIVIVFLFLRNVITPWVMLNNSFQSMLGIASFEHATQSSYLIAYETIAVFLVIAFYKGISRKKKSGGLKIHASDRAFLYKVTAYGSLLICVAALVLVKEFRTQYYTIFTNDITHLVQEKVEYSSGTFLRMLATGGDLLINAVRLIIPSALMYKLAKKDTLLRLFLCFLLVFVQCLFMNDSNAYILMLMLSQLFFVYYLFPSYRKFIIASAVTVVVGFLVLLYVNRFALDHYGSSWGVLLQAYLPSIANTAGVLRIDGGSDFSQIFTDIFQAIPFKGFIFGVEEQDVRTTALIWSETNGISAQIVSTIGEGYRYFGNLLAPLVSCFMIMVSLKTYEKIHTTDNALLLAVYLFFAVYAAAAPFCYNFEIFMRGVLHKLIFMLLIARYAPYSMKSLSQRKQKLIS